MANEPKEPKKPETEIKPETEKKEEEGLTEEELAGVSGGLINRGVFCKTSGPEFAKYIAP